VVNTNGGAPPYQYSINQGPRRGSPILIGLGADTYTVSVLDANGCNYVAEATITSPAPLEVDAGDPEYTISLGDSLSLNAQATNAQGDIFFEWVSPFPGALNCLTCQEITVRPAFTVTYELIGIDSAGCQDNDFVQVFVRKDQIIAVPTGFSPNNDGNNDALLVHGEPDAIIDFFRVYDRHGELVFEIKDQRLGDLTEGWNGQFNGQDMPSDTYVWYIEATFDEQITKVFRGTTTLIR
jgi:gliding motility-associated-like protein